MSSDEEEELRKALDAELLQVTERVGKNKSKATEDEPKEKKKKKKSASKKRKKKKKGSDSEEDDVSEDDEDDFLEEERYVPTPKKKVAPKEPSTPSAAVPLKKRKAADDDLPAEDGEINSSKGAAADEESSEIEPFNDGYDSDLMGDDDDRMKLAKLTEREREQVLAERYERRRELKDQWEDRRRAKDEKHGRKGKRVPSTPRGDSLSAKKRETASAFAELRARRAANKVSTGRPRRSADDEDDEGDEYVDDEPAVATADSKRASSRREQPAAAVEKSEEEQDASAEQIQTVCLRRDQLVKWHHQPFFEKFAPGFFVRIGIGKTRTGEAVYRVAEIVEVKDGREHREYKFGGRPTRRVLVCRQGVAIRSFPMEVVSNSAFSPGELARFLHSTRGAGMPMPTVGVVKQKQQDLKIMENYTYTPEEVDRMVAQKERDRANRRPLNAALERKAVADQLRILKLHMSERSHAAPSSDAFDGNDSQLDRPASNADELDEKEANERKLEELTKRLGELDDWLQQEEEELAQRRSVDVSKINRRNMEINEKQLSEKRRLENEKHRTAALGGARGEKMDPFSRRPTAPSGMYISARMLEDEKKAAAEAAARKKAEAEKAALRASLEHADAPDEHANALGRELAEAMSKAPLVSRTTHALAAGAQPLASPDASAPKPPAGKTLSLNDYFNRLKRDNSVNK